MTTKHELVINTNEPSAPNADSFIHRINETSFSPHQRDFSGFQVGKDLLYQETLYDDRKSVLFKYS